MKNLSLMIVFGFVMMLSMIAFGQATPTPTPNPTYLDGALTWIQSNAAAVATGSILAIFEFLVRAFPTKNPISTLIPIRYAFAGLGIIFTFLGELFNKMIVSAQNIKS